jgi:hypothetical protein
LTSAVQYYAILAAGRHDKSPSGLARRTYEQDGPVDETLRLDLTWSNDSAIVEWEYGDLGAEMIKISERDAERLIEAFTALWAGTD